MNSSYEKCQNDPRWVDQVRFIENLPDFEDIDLTALDATVPVVDTFTKHFKDRFPDLIRLGSTYKVEMDHTWLKTASTFRASYKHIFMPTHYPNSEKMNVIGRLIDRLAICQLVRKDDTAVLRDYLKDRLDFHPEMIETLTTEILKLVMPVKEPLWTEKHLFKSLQFITSMQHPDRMDEIDALWKRFEKDREDAYLHYIKCQFEVDDKTWWDSYALVINASPKSSWITLAEHLGAPMYDSIYVGEAPLPEN